MRQNKTVEQDPAARDGAPLKLELLMPRYWPTWLGLVLLRLCEPLPYRLLVAWGSVLGAVVRRLPVRYVRIARRNIAMCLPELSAAERQRLLAQHFRSVGIAVFETAIGWWSSDRRLQRLTHIEGMEHLERALAKGHGAILLSAHFTTLEIGARAICARMPVNIMYRPSNNKLLAHFLGRNRARRARRAIPRDDIRTLIGALQANEPVWYAPDQSFRSKSGAMVPFFGIPAATNTATSRLARMTGAAVLPYFPERLPGGQGYRIVIHPALENFPTADRIADTVRLHGLIEAQIRRVPEQYLWLHRRFKGLSDNYPNYYGRKPVAPVKVADATPVSEAGASQTRLQ